MGGRYKKIPCIYIIRAFSGSKIGWLYVGQTKYRDRRPNDHFNDLRRGEHENPKLQNYCNKYGIDSLRPEILMQCPENELNFWETWWIKELDTRKNGFNCNDGGQSPNHNGKKGKLKNLKTGEIVEFESVIGFCNEYNLSYQAILNLIKGKHNLSQGWSRVDYEPNIKIYEIVSPEGQIYHIKKSMVKDFCKEHDVDYQSLRRVIIGEQEYFNGWHRKDSKTIERSDYLGNEYDFISPDGKLIHVKNLNQFARNNSLSAKALNHVTRGTQISHRGWRVYKEGMELVPYKKPSYKFVSPNGEIVETDCQKRFAKEQGLSYQAVHYVWAEKTKKHKGWKKFKE